ncbi:MAG: DNA polymerase IV [Planctomycetes bacterium]|nr:DNA polymerase IV [Planctomycetota bacterium]
MSADRVSDQRPSEEKHCWDEATETPVLHVDIDAFFASVEQLRNPRLRGRPVAVGAGVIASCSYEARRFGLHAGMPLREARRRCPKLVIADGHYPIYRCFAEEVFARCREVSPAVETYLDEAYCDFHGVAVKVIHPSHPRTFIPPTPLEGGRVRGGGGIIALARELQQRIRAEVGLSVSAGAGPNRMLAKLASKSVKPGGVRRLAAAEVEEFLVPLPIRMLPGVGPRTEAKLRKLNIETIGALRMLSRASLRGMFGRPGEDLYERCRGQDTRAISTREIPRSISRETSFHQPTVDPGEIEAMLYYLCERAGNALRQLGLAARTVEVKVRTDEPGYRDEPGPGDEPGRVEDGASSTTLPAPTCIDSEIFAAVLSRYRALHTRRVALRLAGVTLSALRPESGLLELDLFEGERFDPRLGFLGREDDLLSRAQAKAERRAQAGRLCASLDAVRERFGYAAVVAGRSLQLLGKLPQDAHGFILRTPCLTR